MSPATIPHPIPYQGSKRRLAGTIAAFMPQSVTTLYEPFAGSAAFTLFAARHDLAQRFVIGDILEPLVNLWKLIVHQPEAVASQYQELWQGQKPNAPEYYYEVRERYNQMHDPVMLLYLVARCVKNAVRFGKDGRFTQSADKRRIGTHPDKMRQAVCDASALLVGRTDFFIGDFEDCIQTARPTDFIYMDPPYQGTTYGADKRYFKQVDSYRLSHVLVKLNERNLPYILSYDGQHGEKEYGVALPEYLNTQRILINAGRSTQATLQGKNVVTMESLYLSPQLASTPAPQPSAEWLQMSLGLESV